jgi:hypothetical protein
MPSNTRHLSERVSLEEEDEVMLDAGVLVKLPKKSK